MTTRASGAVCLRACGAPVEIDILVRKCLSRRTRMRRGAPSSRQAPVGHGQHAVAAARDPGVVRGDDQAAAGPMRLRDKQRRDVLGGLRVQRGGRLIGEYASRMIDQRPRHGHPLTLPSGQLRRPLGAGPLDPDVGQRLSRPLFPLSPADARAGVLQGERDVRQRGQMIDDGLVVRDHADQRVPGARPGRAPSRRGPGVDEQGAAVGPDRQPENAEQGGLPAP